jgi:RsiW-degrading membrane proteinase PrsW (M82 family)
MNVLASLPTVIGVAAIAPALLVLWLVIATDERPIPPAKVWTAFLLGAASISLLRFSRAPFIALLGISDNPWLTLLLRSIFGIAAPEEIVKILVIVAVSLRRRPFTDPTNTVVHGAAVGLGFAAYENLVYLVQHPEMWRALAALRSVLTVPFHGALGIIAGAYLALARSGTALGAHRHDRTGARLRTTAAIFVVPLLLHTCFDLPLLTLQQNPEFGTFARRSLEAASMLVGFGSIAFAGRLVWRIGAHHTPRSETSRERLRNLRSMWALLLAGGGAAFAGTAFLVSSIQHWLSNPDRNVTLLLVPLGFVSIAIGLICLLATATMYVFGRNRLRGTTAPASR